MMPHSSDAKTHRTHAEAMNQHGGHNPNGVHGAHLNIPKIVQGSHDAEKAYLANEYALLDVTEVPLADGSELVIFHRRKL